MTILTPPFGYVEIESDEPVSEAVEVAAKAVGDAMRDYRKGSTLMPWAASPERREAIKYVKATLLSMRATTRAMNDAGAEHLPHPLYETCDYDQASQVWRAMIDEALK